MEIFENVNEPIIDKNTFEIVRKSFETKYRLPKNNFENIFAGLVKYKNCNKNMHHITENKYGKYYLHLRCKNYKSDFFGKKPCDNYASIKVESLKKLSKLNW